MGACAFLIHPPVTMGARRGSTDALTQKSTHAGAYTLALALRQERTSTHIRPAKLARTHAQQRAHVCGKRNLSLPFVTPSLALLTLSPYPSRTYGTVCHEQKLWQGVQGVQNQGMKSTVLLEEALR